MYDYLYSSLPSEERLPLPRLALKEFNERLALILPKIIAFVSSDTLQQHPLWGTAIPYHVPPYGTGTSTGHCVRPDVILTEDGPKICELDFVASGRGYLLAGLGREQRNEALQVFADWYRAMGVRKVFYATASTTVCRMETELFSRCLRQTCGIDIRAGNIDTATDDVLAGALIDRLSYRSEMEASVDRKNLAGLIVSTAEPYLDSKAIFAMIHDSQMTKTLRDEFGADELAFLRNVFPTTTLVADVKNEKSAARIIAERSKWVIKNTDVESNHSWGCRGTIVGATCSGKKFGDALTRESDPNGKNTGVSPILQCWHESRDFWQVWDSVVDGSLHRTKLVHPGTEHDPKTFRPAERAVNARIGFYFLVVRETNKTTVSPYGDLVLRQDRLVHGARDAICCAVEAY